MGRPERAGVGKGVRATDGKPYLGLQAAVIEHFANGRLQRSRAGLAQLEFLQNLVRAQQNSKSRANLHLRGQ